MDLRRLRLIPESAWRTPWQSDTLAGLLCGAIARLGGGDLLRATIIEPASEGKPPFILSDAFPGDWLPIPAFLRLLQWPPEQRKTLKNARWINLTTFQNLQRGQLPEFHELIADSGFLESSRLHNTIARAGSSASHAGALYPRSETYLKMEPEREYLTIYLRCQEDLQDLFLAAFRELALGGFGADRSAGKGQFRLASELDPVVDLDSVPAANGIVVLSTFQPAAGDPTVGAWNAFTKYGKLGPDFGIENVFKRPFILFQPGTCFSASQPRPWIGRSIPMQEFLAPETVAELSARHVLIQHLAFGLALPVVLPPQVSECLNLLS